MSTDNILDKIIAQSKLSSKETAKQQKILQAAITMFAEKGYANTSTSEIAKAAGVAEGTIFRHYGTKQNLLLSVILPFIKDLIPVLAKEFMNDIGGQNFNSFEDFIRAFITNRFNFLTANKEIFQIVVKEFLYRDELPKQLFPHLGSPVTEFVYKILDQFKAKGEIADIPNSTLIKMILSSVAGYFAIRFILAPELFSPADTKELDHLIRYVSNGVKNHA